MKYIKLYSTKMYIKSHKIFNEKKLKIFWERDNEL